MATVVSWSGGKDSARALHALLMDPRVDVRGLLTTITDEFGRVSMHGVRSELIAAQSAALSLPLVPVPIPRGASNDAYESAMGRAMQRLAADGVEAIAFGDLFLADVRRYRERLASAARLSPLFPLWGADPGQLAERLLRDGFRAIIVCVDPRQLDRARCGDEFDSEFLRQLPAATDPCGENGEFHTFVYDAPMFAAPVPVRRGQVLEREGFVFCDLLRRDGETATSGDAPRSGIPPAQ